jgi:glycosyltransferase involved in cell wall biosynthesis
MTPSFSIVAIARNESNTLPRLLKSLEQFQSMGGEIVVVDTGSVDSTAQVARAAGCVVFEEGPRFQRVLDAELARKINEKFVAGHDRDVAKEGDRLFDFAAARNFAVSRAKNDFVLMLDCDEVLTVFDVEAVSKATENVGKLEFQFVFAHDEFGQPLVKFSMSRFYDRRLFHWNPNSIVHETLTSIGLNAASLYLGEDILKSEHWQNEQTDRSEYLTGLALDCFLHPTNDRNSHYFARELFYKGRYASAIKEFERHIEMNGWPVERAQSMVYIGDCYKALGRDELALVWWNQAFLADGTRREPLMRLAWHFFHKNDKHKTAAFASAALAIPYVGFYMDNQAHYRHEPHELLYWALYYLESAAQAAAHWRQALSFQPQNQKYIDDSKFFV